VAVERLSSYGDAALDDMRIAATSAGLGLNGQVVDLTETAVGSLEFRSSEARRVVSGWDESYVYDPAPPIEREDFYRVVLEDVLMRDAGPFTYVLKCVSEGGKVVDEVEVEMTGGYPAVSRKPIVISRGAPSDLVREYLGDDYYILDPDGAAEEATIEVVKEEEGKGGKQRSWKVVSIAPAPGTPGWPFAARTLDMGEVATVSVRLKSKNNPNLVVAFEDKEKRPTTTNALGQTIVDVSCTRDGAPEEGIWKLTATPRASGIATVYITCEESDGAGGKKLFLHTPWLLTVIADPRRGDTVERRKDGHAPYNPAPEKLDLTTIEGCAAWVSARTGLELKAADIDYQPTPPANEKAIRYEEYRGKIDIYGYHIDVPSELPLVLSGLIHEVCTIAKARKYDTVDYHLGGGPSGLNDYAVLEELQHQCYTGIPIEKLIETSVKDQDVKFLYQKTIEDAIKAFKEGKKVEVELRIYHMWLYRLLHGKGYIEKISVPGVPAP